MWRFTMQWLDMTYLMNSVMFNFMMWLIMK